MAVRFSPFSVDVCTELPLALPPRESESGDLALVPVSPSPRSPFVSGAEASVDFPVRIHLAQTVSLRPYHKGPCALPLSFLRRTPPTSLLFQPSDTVSAPEDTALGLVLWEAIDRERIRGQFGRK